MNETIESLIQDIELEFKKQLTEVRRLHNEIDDAMSKLINAVNSSIETGVPIPNELILEIIKKFVNNVHFKR